MTTLVLTVIRGLRSRALLSGGSILLVALAVASAVLGPQFSQAVTNSFLITRIDEAPNELTGLTWRYTPDGATAGDPGQALRLGATAADAAPGPFLPARPVLESQRFDAFGPAQAALVAVDGACEHLRVEGRCPEQAGEAMMLTGDAQATLTQLGTVVDIGDVPVTVVGTYEAPSVTEEDFWFAPLRYTSFPPRGPPTPTPFRPAPLITPAATFDSLPAGTWTVRVDRLLAVPRDLTIDGLGGVVAQARTLSGPAQQVEGGSLVGESINDIGAILTEARTQQSTAQSSIAPAVISVVLVALALLLRLLTAAADLRLPELALASLRGVPRRRMWQLGLAEPLALLLVAVPVGALGGLLFSWVLVRSWLVPGLPVPFPWTALVAALVVAIGAATVAVVAVGLVLRLPLTDQLTGVRRPQRTGRASLVTQLALVAAAVAVLASKLSAAGPGEPDVTDLVLPVLLAVVAGLAATRVSVVLARWWTRRRTRSLPTYVAARAISRRREGSLVILPVTAAIAICVFGAGVYSSAGQWRASVAATAAPAAVLWSSPLGLADSVALTHTVDPDGQWLMAAGTLSSQGPTYAILDTPRLARVGIWPDQWTPGTSPEEISRLLSPTAVQPVVTGSRIGLTVERDTAATPPGEDVYVRLRLTSGRAAPDFVFLGPYPVGTAWREAPAPAACASGCTVEAITIGKRAALPLAITGDVRLTGLSIDGADVPDAFAGAGWRQSAQASAGDAVSGVVTAGRSLVVTFDAPDPVIGQLVSGDIPDALPVVRGVDAASAAAPGSTFNTSALAVDLDPVVVGRSVPLLGPVGVLIDYRMFSTGRELYDQGNPVYVLTRSDTPASVTSALQARGLTVSTTYAGQKRVLDNSAYALALRLYAVVAVLVLLMALAGLFVSTAVQLPARRRDAASLRVVGVPRRTVMSAVLRELCFVLASTALAGLAAGTIAQYVVLRTVTLGYVEDLVTPALVAAIDPVRLAVLAGLALLLFGGVAVASALLTVRGARGSTLRENAR